MVPPCVRYLLFLRAVRIYGIMSFTDSRIHCSHCLHRRHPPRFVFLVPPLQISQMFLHRNYPSYATRAKKAEMYIPPPCLTRAFQSFSPTLPCCIQATRSGRFFTYRWHILTLHSRVVPQALCAMEICERETKIEINSSNQINSCYESAVCTFPEGLDSINVTLPDGCPNKRRLPRDSEQLGRYSKGSQRRLDSPRAIQFPLRKRLQ
jgi:hypothetical protein